MTQADVSNINIDEEVFAKKCLNEALIYVCTLGRIVNNGLTVLFGLLKESLTDSLVHDDQSDFWRFVLAFFAIKVTILFLNDLI